MKIVIDTKHDTPSDIRKAIEFLQQLTNEPKKEHYQNIFDSPTSEQKQEPTTGFINMFGSADEAEKVLDQQTRVSTPESPQPKDEDDDVPQAILDQVKTYD